MTDRELLELAAKAAGIKGEWSRWHQSYGNLWVEGIDTGGRLLWNPLVDDGDAIRLLVILNMDLLNCHPDSIMAKYLEFEEACAKGDEPYVATRRAIVRAAAEIGKQMP